VKNLIDIEARGDLAMKRLTETDEKAADLKHVSDMMQERYNAIVDTRMLMSDKSSADLRKAEARTHKESQDALRDWLAARLEFDKIANMRISEGKVAEWCRSLYANYRQGQ
jgi:hypothetical protein